MKQILYILNDNARRFTYARCASLYQAIQTADEIINLFIMRSDGHIRFSQEHNRGEYNIFHLPEYRDYDAVILDLNSNFSAGSNIYGAKGALYAIEAARASGKPVLSVANDIPSFYYIGIDNHAAMTSVIQYLHEEEGLTDFWFAMGPADNYENLQRTEALRDYCAAHGISCGEDRFYSESFVLKSGTHAFHTLLKSHNGCLPQAVICANDLIAMGVSSAAETLGFRIPEDFRVTGFDNINVSGYLSPSLTTVDQMCWRFGDVALNALIRKWRGETIPHNIITPTRLVLRESTGHHELSQTDVKSHAGRLIIEDFEVDDFGYAISAMQHKLPGCKTIEDICMVLTECLAALGCKGCQLVLDRELFEYVSLSGFNQQAERGLDVSGELSVDGYSDRMEIVFTWMVGRKPLFEHFHVSAKLQTEQFPGAKENHLFIPLHFMEHTVGYLSIWNCLEMIRIKCVSSVSNTFTMALRNYFIRRNLSHVNSLLSGLSMTDDLTGLYNRLGYHDLVNPLFRRQCNCGKGLGILFIDMDRLKHLNDSYDHATGDKAILSVANAILSSMPEHAIPVRYGGDEFLVFIPCEEINVIERMLDGFMKILPVEARKQGVPEPLSVSYGMILTDPSSGKTIGEYVRDADALMYEQKRAKKCQRM